MGPAPRVPGNESRLRWLPESHPDVVMIRERVQEGAPGLYVFGTGIFIGGSEALTLVEAYYPDGMRPAMWEQLDPMRQSDWAHGNLVSLASLAIEGATFPIQYGYGDLNCFFHLDDEMLHPIRKNNRAARSLSFKRNLDRHSLELAIQDKQHEESEAAIMNSPWIGIYSQAHEDSRKFGMKPFISQYTGRKNAH